ncbi:hypothetical protein [Tenacibaculum agarivorans]|uniref:hypothetical protein n=1 Tax=Tenacibaculum agarivorans TaxID=1908389 RepID=UPI00094B872D|nr:hypothetical protein [Tenacibaculum agarivorans]
MKKLGTFLSLCLFSLIAFAQTPEGFNYQSVVRDATGNVIANTAIGVQFQLHQTTATGTVVYTETHTPTTNAYGVFDVVVGQGTSTDDFSTISWSSDNHFLEVSVDITGGTTYVSMGTTQLLSVPYALQAKYVENGDNLGDHTLTENIKTAGKWISNDGDDEGLLVNSGGRVTTSHKLFLGSNINLDTHWINGDGTDNKGIQFDTSGNVNLGGNIKLNDNWLSNDGDNEGIKILDNGNVSISDNIQLNGNWLSNDGDDEGIKVLDNGTIELTGNIKLADNWINNDGGDEGLQFDTSGNVTSSGTLTLGGNALLNNNWLSNDGGNEGLQIDNSGNVTTSGNLTLGGNFQLNGILTSPSENQIFGTYDDTSNLSNLDRRNVVIGYQAAEGAQSGDSNVVIGYFAGYNLNGDSNVLIGTAAGAGGTFSNQLHIRDLIYGEFDNSLLQVKGELKVDENISTDGNVIIDEDGDDLRAVGAANNVEIISIIVDTDGTLNSNVTNSTGITTSLSGNTYTVNYSNHFSSIPSVTITCVASTSVTRAAQITSLAQGKVEYQVRSSGGDNKTDAITVLQIIGKR